MSATTTVMFADLTGSTAVFETLGNDAATQTITGLTNWIGQVVKNHGGRVVKTLGDGVLALFPDGASSVRAVVLLQREHARRRIQRGPAHSMELQVGLACGEVVEVAGDCYGDAVNVASRLSDLSGAREIWATDTVVEQLRMPPPGTRFHPLGLVPIRGKALERELFRIEWQEDTSTDMMTLPGFGPGELARQARAASQGRIELRYLGLVQDFGSDELPIHMGRAREAEFVIADPRVSRLHARIEWHINSFILSDLSSYGTSVRFQGAPTQQLLRRDECVLHDSGEIALGPDFGDFSVATIQFALSVSG
ncbi:MAG: adenylate/guanylate cyclase protein [Ramlibacter sp.]|jgi:adenylate cyclase|nr:adenylate/guanylate cyclase protein [Ramlibacter sp.]MDB5911477.1 adenylate/guanylate cyclase protein [Ramlibacter sp.]